LVTAVGYAVIITPYWLPRYLATPPRHYALMVGNGCLLVMVIAHNGRAIINKHR